MKKSSRIVICISSFCVVLACLAVIFLSGGMKDSSSNENTETNNSETNNTKTSNTDNDDSNLWEKEFYNCAENLMNRIEQVDASEYVLPEADERDRLERIEVYSTSWLAYMSFVANWVQREGTSTARREEVYRQATLLMVLIDDNHDASLGYGDLNREYCEFIYDHGETREELLFAGNQALRMENVIDESAERLREEFEKIDHWGFIDESEAAAWEAEFYNCMERYAESLKSEKDEQVLRLWGEFVGLWAENNEDFERIESGSGLSFFMAHRRRECFRTATLLMVYQMEQNGLDYQFIYDVEADRDFIKKAYE